MMFRLFIALVSAVLLSACSTPSSDTNDEFAPKEVSIAYLKSLCSGSHYRVVGDYIIRGVVVATDWLGEMNKSAVIVDESGGLEFAIDSRQIRSILPIYSKVSIYCNGLMLARIGGKIELGAPPTGEFPLDNIDDDMFNRYIRVEGVCEDFTPPTKLFTELNIGDIGRVIRFDNVRVCAEECGLAWCDTIENEAVTTFRTLVDMKNNSLAVRTLSTCHYACEAMPTKEISVVGVVDYSDNRYFLRIVNKWIIE